MLALSVNAALLLVASLVLVGCATPTRRYAYPPGGTNEQFVRDAKLCNLDSQTVVMNTWFGSRLPHQIDRRLVKCMEQLGYRHLGVVEKPPPSAEREALCRRYHLDRLPLPNEPGERQRRYELCLQR